MQQHSSIMQWADAQHAIPLLTIMVCVLWAIAELTSLPKSRKQLHIPRGDWLSIALGLVPVTGVGATMVWQYLFPPVKLYPSLLLPGVILCLGGIFLRTWSKMALGRYYTFAIGLTEGHRVLTDGPYGLVRHPLYLGTLLAITGFPLLAQSWAALFLLTAPTVLVYGLRLVREDAYLVENMGPAYREYARRTQRLIPFVW
jgi:protein-S-isoprenylcysteine O-methyltransferase